MSVEGLCTIRGGPHLGTLMISLSVLFPPRLSSRADPLEFGDVRRLASCGVAARPAWLSFSLGALDGSGRAQRSVAADLVNLGAPSVANAARALDVLLDDHLRVQAAGAALLVEAAEDGGREPEYVVDALRQIVVRSPTARIDVVPAAPGSAGYSTASVPFGLDGLDPVLRAVLYRPDAGVSASPGFGATVGCREEAATRRQGGGRSSLTARAAGSRYPRHRPRLSGPEPDAWPDRAAGSRRGPAGGACGATLAGAGGRRPGWASPGSRRTTAVERVRRHSRRSGVERGRDAGRASAGCGHRSRWTLRSWRGRRPRGCTLYG